MLKDIFAVQEDTIKKILEEFNDEEQVIITRFNKRIEEELSRIVSTNVLLKNINDREGAV